MSMWQELLIGVPLFIILAAAVIVGNGYKRRMKAACRQCTR